MSEPSAQPDEAMTVEQVIEAVHKTGFRIVSDNKGGASLSRSNNQSHVPGSLMNELKSVKEEILVYWQSCDRCKCSYAFIHRLDVGKLCDQSQCPNREKK